MNVPSFYWNPPPKQVLINVMTSEGWDPEVNLSETRPASVDPPQSKVSTMWSVRVRLLSPSLGQRKTLMWPSLPHTEKERERGGEKVCVCVCLTIDSHAINWRIFIRSRLCDMGYISPSMVVFFSYLILPLLLSSSLSCPFSSYLQTQYYFSSYLQTKGHLQCVRSHVTQEKYDLLLVSVKRFVTVSQTTH